MAQHKWSIISGQLVVRPEIGIDQTLVLEGRVNPPVYTEAHLTSTVVASPSPGAGEVAGPPPSHMGLVRYRMLKRMSEYAGIFQMAAYYDQMISRAQHELFVNGCELETDEKSTTGLIQSDD